jgi:FAD/FMN-containing dehydrogenase
VPRTVDAGADAIAVCREHSAPVVSRGGGTSLAGQCTNTAVMIDWAKYCHRLVSVDVDAKTCVVEPGIVLDVLNAQLKPHGLRYGPEPELHAGRDDRQQLLRRHRPAHRQSGRQPRRSGRAAL